MDASLPHSHFPSSGSSIEIQSLHWLTVHFRIDVKNVLFVYYLNALVPQYLAETLNC